MSSYDQIIKIKASYYRYAKDFFSFLQAVGRKYFRPVKINYRYLKRGRFYVIVDGSPGGIDALFQELILNRGLYYYICTINSGNKRDIVNNVVIPLFRSLLEHRFPNPYSRFLRRHITGKSVDDRHVPGELINRFSHEYEVLFRKWDIGSIDDWNFIKDADAFLTRFMLSNLGYKPGKRSPKFHVLVDHVYRKGIGMKREYKGIFNNVHKARTEGLHRLNDELSKNDISHIAMRLYNYFEYYDEFIDSQSIKTSVINGKKYRRIKYGDELWPDINGNQQNNQTTSYQENSESTDCHCHNCGAVKGQYHCIGCNAEQCARCKGHAFGCECKYD